jgi:hypothetical protein
VCVAKKGTSEKKGPFNHLQSQCFHLCVEGVGVCLPDLRGAYVAVVYEKVRQGGGDRAVEEGCPGDAVGGLHVLIDLHVVFHYIAVLGEADAVSQDLALVVV